MTSDKSYYQQAILSLNSGNFVEAERSFKAFLRRQPQHVGALNLLTIALMSMERFAEAEGFVRAAVRINANSDVSFYNYGIILKKLGRLQEALEKFDLAIRLNPGASETWNNRGTVFNDMTDYQRAVSDFDHAIALNHNHADAHANKGKALNCLRRYDKSLAAYDKALTLKPDLAEAWLGRGNCLAALKSYDGAIAAYDKALAIKANLTEAWLGRGKILTALGRYDEAIVAYDNAVAIKNDSTEIWLDRGFILTNLKRYEEAIAAYDRALELKADLLSAWIGRGQLFFLLERYNDALFSYDRALELKRNSENMWLERGIISFALERYDEALIAFEKALVLKPDLDYAAGFRLFAKMHLCDWHNFDADVRALISSVRQGLSTAQPMVLLSAPSSPSDQLQCARLWAARHHPLPPKKLWNGQRYEHERIRIAYVSSDFRPHPVAVLIAGLIENHDRKRFEVTGLSLQPENRSEIGKRLKQAFEHFFDVSRMTDDGIAHLIREREIDIAVDLNGYTQNCRTNIFAHRPAPIQVNYLGYPGTMGADYVDYLIADHTLIPEVHRHCYTENIVYLPHTYQANDQKRRISEKQFTRSEFGLPDEVFVFCCFNANSKIVPERFDVWMRILKKVERSILWLLEGNIVSASNLRKAAAAQGINPERLVFAKRIRPEEHLARHRLADLFLDTLPYSAHTTASDALWAGLPVLT